MPISLYYAEYARGILAIRHETLPSRLDAWMLPVRARADHQTAKCCYVVDAPPNPISPGVAPGNRAHAGPHDLALGKHDLHTGLPHEVVP